jgi:hypothetical protein
MMTILLYLPAFFGLSIEVYFILATIGSITFFFWRWLFKKYIENESRRKTATWLATLFITPIIYAGLITVFIYGLSYEPSLDFDQSQWTTDREGRYQMANDLIDSKILIGKDTNQVKQTLGDPTWHNVVNKEWIYNMGMGGGGLGFMFHNLVVKFSNGKVATVRHEQIRD